MSISGATTVRSVVLSFEGSERIFEQADRTPLQTRPIPITHQSAPRSELACQPGKLRPFDSQEAPVLDLHHEEPRGPLGLLADLPQGPHVLSRTRCCLLLSFFFLLLFLLLLLAAAFGSRSPTPSGGLPRQACDHEPTRPPGILGRDCVLAGLVKLALCPTTLGCNVDNHYHSHR